MSSTLYVLCPPHCVPSTLYVLLSSTEVSWVSATYDIEKCSAWVQHAQLVQAKVGFVTSLVLCSGQADLISSISLML